ncbi:hypothetical protein V8E54_009092 [Elaphomyces granulatus]
MVRNGHVYTANGLPTVNAYTAFSTHAHSLPTLTLPTLSLYPRPVSTHAQSLPTLGPYPRSVSTHGQQGALRGFSTHGQSLPTDACDRFSSPDEREFDQPPWKSPLFSNEIKTPNRKSTCQLVATCEAAAQKAADPAKTPTSPTEISYNYLEDPEQHRGRVHHGRGLAEGAESLVCRRA